MLLAIPDPLIPETGAWQEQTSAITSAVTLLRTRWYNGGQLS